MDPNKTLEEMRQLYKAFLAGDFALDDESPERLAELCESMDNWLSSGGFLPTDWQRNR